MSDDELKLDVEPEIVDRGTAPVVATPDAPKEVKRRGRGVDLSSLDSQALREHKKAINHKTRKKAKDAKDKASTAYDSPAEPTKTEALQILDERGIRNEHIKNAVYKMLLVAALNNRIPPNRFLFANGIQQTLASIQALSPRPLQLESPNEYPEGELSTRAELNAVMDAFWRGEPITLDQWLADRLKFKSSAFEMSQLLGKEDFGRVHLEWTNFAPRWNPIGLKPNYTLREALAWLNAQSAKHRFLLVASRNSMKSTWVRILALCLTLICPDAPILICSETNKLSRKAMREFRGYLEMNPNSPTKFQQYFGEFAVSSDSGSSLTYENPLAHLGLPQVACESSSLEAANTGSRFWLALFDDPISRDNGTGNEEQRAAALAKWGSIMRLRDPSGYAINIQTPWEVDDLGDVMIKRNQEDPEHPLVVRIDPVMEIKPEARGKALLDLTEDDVILNFLPKLNWKFVRDEMRSPEGLKFYRTQYMCEWVKEEEDQKVQFDHAEIWRRVKPLSYFENCGLAQTFLAVDRSGGSTSKYADFNAAVVGRVQNVDDRQALVCVDAKLMRAKDSELIRDVLIPLISKHNPVTIIFEEAQHWADFEESLRRELLRRGMVVPYLRHIPIDNTPKAKSKRIARLENPLSEGRLYFNSGILDLETCLLQLENYDPNKKSNGYRKEDFPDSLALLADAILPRTYHEPEDPEAARERERREQEDADRARRQHFYGAMFGNQYTPPPPKVEINPEPSRAQNDPRMKLFGNRGPWRL